MTSRFLSLYRGLSLSLSLGCMSLLLTLFSLSRCASESLIFPCVAVLPLLCNSSAVLILTDLIFSQVTELERRMEQLQREVQQKALQVDNLSASQEKYKRQEQDAKRQVLLNRQGKRTAAELGKPYNDLCIFLRFCTSPFLYLYLV